jgi:3-oxoadipate enol-lactonase
MIALIDDLEIAYDDVGTGPPVVFVHGFPHNRTLWAPQVNALVDHARCVALDLRGFGESTRRGPYTIDQYADDVAALIRSLRLERAIIAGISMGGYIAFALWRRHRALVRGLILCDTRPGADTEDGRAKRNELIAAARAKGSGSVADAMIGGMVGTTTREKYLGIVDAVYTMLALSPVDGVVGALEAMRERIDSTPTLSTIDVPTLIVCGSEDAFTPPAESEAMHAAIPSSRLEILSGAGHLSNVERPAAFNHVVSEFIASIGFA